MKQYQQPHPQDKARNLRTLLEKDCAQRHSLKPKKLGTAKSHFIWL